MPPKKKPLPLHVSLARIELERINVAKRTEMHIAQLHKVEDVEIEWHRCLHAFFFCVLLLLLNLLFLQ
jgi:hypothetical protein